MAHRMVSIKKVMDLLVPISRFNRGEANKIFEEVREQGMKIVLKNNESICVLIAPEKYEAMVEALEDYEMYFKAAERQKEAVQKGYLSSAEVMNRLGVHHQDLTDVEVEID